MNVNVVVVAGNLTRDPELRYTTSGTAVGNFNIAVNRVWQKDGVKQEEVSFIKIVVWGRLAETCGEYLTKGRGALIEGRLKQETWQAQDVGKRERTCVVAERVQFIGDKKPNAAPPETEQGYPAGTNPNDIPV